MATTTTKKKPVYARKRGEFWTAVTLKDGVDEAEYLAKQAGKGVTAFRCGGQPPSVRTMQNWMMDGVAKAIDGCRVEPDGYCTHQKPSWLLVLEVI